MIDLFINLIIAIVTVITITCASTYLYLKKQYKFWEAHGISGPKPKMIFGTMKDLFDLKVTEAEMADKLYKEYPNEKLVGIYTLWKPGLLIKDIDLIKQILVNDFGYFTDHPDIRGHSHTDSIFDSVFSMKGNIWKERRHFLSKVFTPKKLKDYVQDIDSCMKTLFNEIEKEMSEDHHLGNLMDRHMVRIICTTLYGLDVSNDEDRISGLSYHSNLFSHPPKATALKALIYTVSPKLFELLKVNIYPKCIWNYFSSLTTELINARHQSEIERDDFLQLVIKMKENNIMKNGKISYEETVAHIYIFFIGSHHTVELTISHVLLQLALHPTIQEKLRQEVDDVLVGSTDITYEHLTKMTYLDCVISETLRIYPLGGVIKRVCTKPFKLNDNLTIPLNTDIIIPVSSIHMDPQFFPEPEKFHPERFSCTEQTPFAFMPFGRGPRLCIGMRLAEVSVKLVIAKLLSNYLILPSEKMKFPMKFNPETLIITCRPIDGVWVKLKSRKITI